MRADPGDWLAIEREPTTESDVDGGRDGTKVPARQGPRPVSEPGEHDQAGQKRTWVTCKVGVER